MIIIYTIIHIHINTLRQWYNMSISEINIPGKVYVSDPTTNLNITSQSAPLLCTGNAIVNQKIHVSKSVYIGGVEPLIDQTITPLKTFQFIVWDERDKSLYKTDISYINNVVNAPTISDTYMPIGSIIIWPLDTLPPFNAVYCNGQELDKVLYNNLYSVIGDIYGSTLTTFNVPDYRGMFLRSTDNASNIDPGVSSRVQRADSVGGDNTGTTQQFTTAVPASPFVISTTGDHRHSLTMKSVLTGTEPNSVDNQPSEFNAKISAPGGSHSHVINQGGDSETRPVNVNVKYYIISNID